MLGAAGVGAWGRGGWGRRRVGGASQWRRVRLLAQQFYGKDGVLGVQQDHSQSSTNIEDVSWDFPGAPVVKTPCFHCRGHRFNPWSGN